MKDTDYAYAVARIRANEAKLFSKQDFEALLGAKDFGACIDILKSKNRIDSMSVDFDVSKFVSDETKKLWTLLCESVPDKKQLDLFCIQNDFFNIKAVIKSAITGEDSSKLFKFPTSLNLEELEKAVRLLDFSLLDEPFSSVCKTAYETAIRTENGQSADIIIDKATLNLMTEFSKKSKDSMVKAVVNFLVATANIKIAYRCQRTKKDKQFVDKCLCECDLIDVKKLSELTTKTEKDLFDYLSKTDFSKGIELLKQSGTLFEKWIDDSVTEITKSAKYKFFGFEPIVAYYFAKRTEIKMLRLILCGKQSGLSEEIIKERMRELYV